MPSVASQAEHVYRDGIPVSCSCRFTVDTRPVPGLGDQATAALITLYLDTGTVKPARNALQIALMVRSGNAIVQLIYGVNAGPLAPPRPAAAALLAADVAMARDVLAALPRA